ncbi:7137_t:CDS:2, partial [Dentiscutata erythropus]
KVNIIKPNESKKSTELPVLSTPTPLATISPLPPIEDKWRIWPPDLRYAICRPKIYIYKIPPEIQIDEFQKQRCIFSKYNVELILYNQLSTVNSSLYKLYITEKPEEADLFYIPFFGSCYLFNCWIKNNWNEKEKCQRNIDQKFRRYNTIIIPSSTPILNIFRLNPHQFVDKTGSPRGRNIKGIFRGSYANTNVTDIYSDGIKHVIFNGLKGLPGWNIEESSDREEYSRLLARTKYGLTSSEWTLDTTRIWEYLSFGVVPIVIDDGIIKPFEDDVDWDSMIVRVRRSEFHRISEILDAISEDEYQKKRKRVWLIGRYMVINNGCAWHFIVRSFCRMLKMVNQEVIDIEGYTHFSI